MPKAPLILVPGSLHSTLLVRSVAHGRGCAGTGNQTVVQYLNWSRMLHRGDTQACWIADMALELDAEGRFVPPQGVHISVAHGPGSTTFGTADALPACDPWTCPTPSTYHNFVQALVETAGYTPGVDLLVAPYDWRHAPGPPLDAFCAALAQLVMDAHARSSHRVLLVGHSAGPPLVGYCLRAQPASWREAHVRGMISLNGLVGGEVDCLETLWRGGDFENEAMGVPKFDRHAYRRTQWTWGVTSWCLPQAGVYGARPLLRVGSDVYTARSLEPAFARFGLPPEVERVWQLVANSTPAEASPGVKVWCLYGTGVPTPIAYAFPDGNLSTTPLITWGDGDGQQPTESNAACLRWRRDGTEVVAQAFVGVDHDQILNDSSVVRYVVDSILQTTVTT
jgi:lysophospholipase-3